METSAAIEQLCPQCALCCNGMLFGDVELLRREDAARFRRLGLNLFQRGRKTCLAQPCTALQGSCCTIYAERPHHCRTFECRLLQSVKAGVVTPADARKKIKRALAQAEKIEHLLHFLGNKQKDQPLAARFRAVLSEPEDLSQPARLGRYRSRLMVEVEKMMKILQEHFL